MFSRFFALFAACIVLAMAPALAAKKVALVIGNNDYAEITVLQKAVNDARAMRDALQDDLGFEVVYGENQDQRQMNALINDFEARVEEGDIAFIYFSGHGVAIRGENFLTPTDVPQPRLGEETILTGRSFGSAELIDRIHEKKARAIFTVLDACRNNPFKVAGGKSLGGGDGLQKIDTAEGVFVLFAAGIGQEALDRVSETDENPNSVFTRVLIPLLKTGGLTQYQLAKAVQNEVTQIAASIGHKQNPAYYDQIIGDVILKDGVLNVVPELPLIDTGKTDLALNDNILKPLVELEWGQIESSDDEAAIKEFIEKYPDTPVFTERAKSRLAILALSLDGLKLEPSCAGVFAEAAGEKRCLEVGTRFADCEKCPEVVVLPTGSFMMGSTDDETGRVENEGPQHEVNISKTLAIGRFEVTRDEYLEFLSNSEHPGDILDLLQIKNGKLPIANVTRADAQAYATWLSAKTGFNYRLPTEAEWEFAARAGNTSRYVTGDNVGDELANIGGTKGGVVAVGQYAANGFGLFDMAGNVFEWTADCFVPNYDRASTDGSAQSGDDQCEGVNRGGSWNTPNNQTTDYLRVAFRSVDSADTKDAYVGFRVLREF